MSEIVDNYHHVQQDVLETFIDRGQLRKLAEPTVLASGKRIPGLKLDHLRQLAVMHSLVRFANIAAGGTLPRPPSTPQPSMLSAKPKPSTRWPRSAMTYPNYNTRGWSRSPSLSPLSTGRQGLLHLPGLPQALGKDLRASHGRLAGAIPRRPHPRRRETMPTRPPISTHLRQSGRTLRQVGLDVAT
jgi:hypothetical protein